jgi:hypothetical protein
MIYLFTRRTNKMAKSECFYCLATEDLSKCGDCNADVCAQHRQAHALSHGYGDATALNPAPVAVLEAEATAVEKRVERDTAKEIEEATADATEEVAEEVAKMHESDPEDPQGTPNADEVKSPTVTGEAVTAETTGTSAPKTSGSKASGSQKGKSPSGKSSS